MKLFKKKKKYAGMIGSENLASRTKVDPPKESKTEYHLFLEKRNEILRYEYNVVKVKAIETIISAANSQVKMDFNQESIFVRLRDGWSTLKICKDGSAILMLSSQGRFEFNFTVESMFDLDPQALKYLIRIFTAGIKTDGRGNWGEARD